MTSTDDLAGARAALLTAYRTANMNGVTAVRDLAADVEIGVHYRDFHSDAEEILGRQLTPAERGTLTVEIREYDEWADGQYAVEDSDAAYLELLIAKLKEDG